MSIPVADGRSVDLSADLTQAEGNQGLRRLGHVVTVLVNVFFLVVLNLWPGWGVLPFLTPQMSEVISVLNLSLIVGALLQIALLVNDGPRLRLFAEAATSAMSALVLSRLLVVFPFDVATASIDWSWPLRVLLGLALLGSLIGTAVALGRLLLQSWSR